MVLTTAVREQSNFVVGLSAFTAVWGPAPATLTGTIQVNTGPAHAVVVETIHLNVIGMASGISHYDQMQGPWNQVTTRFEFVPEPDSAGLLLLGVALCVGYRKLRR